jgi:hypothetical protein
MTLKAQKISYSNGGNFIDFLSVIDRFVALPRYACSGTQQAWDLIRVRPGGLQRGADRQQRPGGARTPADQSRGHKAAPLR